MKEYCIEKPTSDSGIIVLILKYTTTFIVPWLAGWLFLSFFLSSKSKIGGHSENIGTVLGLLNILIAVIICIFHIIDSLKKYKMGTPFKFIFDFEHYNLSIRTINTINEKEKEIIIDFNTLRIVEEKKVNLFLGKQRVFNIYNKDKLITILNIDLTAWCRYEQLNELIEKLRQKSN